MASGVTLAVRRWPIGCRADALKLRTVRVRVPLGGPAPV